MMYVVVLLFENVPKRYKRRSVSRKYALIADNFFYDISF